MDSAKLVSCAVFAALLTACSSGGDSTSGGSTGDGTAETTDAGAVPTSAPPAFDDFPGDGVVFIQSGMRVGVKTKAIDSTWTTEVMGSPANPGYHYLAVWIAVTPELADRGADEVNIDKVFHLRYKPSGGTCGGSQPTTSGGYCYHQGNPGSQLVALEDGGWRDHQWEKGEYVRSALDRGETRFGQIGFQIDDTVEPSEFELCTPSREEPFSTERFPCTPVKAPDGSR
ncbi:hypothetical protein [Actinokineospora sp. UTMC 2448]|uniref:hypothetical protein n=1 Tax=Actinokineospora sp. UTMC 2448 TaxID=2268449 RepID=UPI0021645E4A|nr:hypothetical protein [Actinokineospora sp. UTMC 2448]UVS79513.1 hypothetical protein Actkin_03263 [Actinokineospora sp. UTMC 2448]